MDAANRVTAVNRTGPGVYLVTFDRSSIRNCAAFATISDPAKLEFGANGTIQAYPLIAAGASNVLVVRTFLPDGKTPNDYGFNVMAMC